MLTKLPSLIDWQKSMFIKPGTIYRYIGHTIALQTWDICLKQVLFKMCPKKESIIDDTLGNILNNDFEKLKI